MTSLRGRRQPASVRRSASGRVAAGPVGKEEFDRFVEGRWVGAIHVGGDRWGLSPLIRPFLRSASGVVATGSDPAGFAGGVVAHVNDGRLEQGDCGLSRPHS